MVFKTVHAAGEHEMDKARQHAAKSGDEFNAAGQHAASAASTVGHDLRAAGQQAAEAAKYVGERLTAPVAGEEQAGEDVKRTAQAKSRSFADDAKATGNEAAEETKSIYGNIKSSIGNLFGGKKNDDVPGSDVAHKAAHKVNKGLDKAQNKQQDAYESSASKDDVKEHGQQALDSAKDMAVQTKDTVVGGLSYVKGRLTAPVSGDEGKDEDIKEDAKEKTRQAADRVSSAAQTAQDKMSAAAQETKEQSKGLFASIKDALAPKDQPETATYRAKDTDEKAKSTLAEVEDKVKDTMESAKASLRDAAEAVEPKTATEAIQAEGGIPSNTADLLKEQEFAQKATIADHEGVEGQKIGITGILGKTAEGWGGEGLTGEGTLGSVRDAADQAGPHSRMK